MNKYYYYTIFLVLVLVISACSSQTTTDEETEPAETEEKAQSDQQTEQASEPKPVDWAYEGETGPKHWGDLSNKFAACEEGDKQSPVNIKFSEVEGGQNLPEVQFHYEQTTPSVINNGHSIQFNLPAEESLFIKMDGTKYELNQFHFHTPSEHQFNGENLPMEMHLVHQNANDELAVITLMIKEGTENKELSSIWGELPTKKMEKDIKMKESIELMELIPESSSTFYYSGSLTTPPCSESVKWIVFENPIEMSEEQIEEFKQIFPNNNRPIQSLNKREVIKNE